MFANLYFAKPGLSVRNGQLLDPKNQFFVFKTSDVIKTSEVWLAYIFTTCTTPAFPSAVNLRV